MSIFNLSADDMSPYPTAGLNFDTIGWCDKLIAKWPGLKVDFFVPAAYSRLSDKDPYFLSNYMDWVGRLNALPKKNYRINYHGYYHKRLSVKYGNSNNDEFQYLNYDQAQMLIHHMIGEFRAAGIKSEQVFRAPGFKLSVETARVLTDLGITIAGNQEYYDRLRGKVSGMKYIVSNWDMNDECALKGDVLACGHTSLWCKNVLNEATYNRVVRLLESRPFEFKFLSEF